MKRKAEPDAEEMASSKGPSTSKKLAPDANNDFINETELQKSIQVSVLKSADDVSEEFRMLGGEIEFDPDVVAHVSALVWDTVSDDWTSDLLEFSRHAGRETVNVSDVMIIMRRNRCLLEMLAKAIDIDIDDYERPLVKRQRVNNKESRVKRAGGVGTDKRGDSLRNSPVGQCTESNPKPVSSADLHASKCRPSYKKENLLKVLHQENFDDDIVAENPLTKKQQAAHHKHSGVDQEDPTVDDMEFLGPIQAELLNTSTPLATKIEIQETMRTEDGEPTAQSYRDSPSVRNAQNALETVDATSIKTIHMELDNMLGKSQNIVGGSPKATTSKSPSPDLFNTPVKGILSEFDDDVKISEPRHLTNSHQVPMSGEVTRIIDAGSKKSACGWSAKFSEFSFLDSIPTDASELKCTKEAPRKRTKQSSRELRHRSRDITSSKTPKHSSVATSKLDSARTSRSTGPSSSVRSTSSRTPQEKSIAASVPSSSSSLPKGSSSRLKSHPSKALHFTMDSDDDFFDL